MRIRKASSIPADEVLDVRIEGKPVRGHIDEFVQDLITSAQQTNRIVEKAVKEVESYYPPDRVDSKELVKVVASVIRRQWGNDPMLRELAEALATGKHVF